MAADASDGFIDFLWNLYKIASKNADGKSVFLSPLSVAYSLAMAFAGSAGKSKKELQDALFGSGSNDQQAAETLDSMRTVFQVGKFKEVTLKTANRLYSHHDFEILSTFVEHLKKGFSSSVVSVDFANCEKSRSEINAWVSGETDGKISDLIPKGLLTSLTKLILVNAVYFKGNWEKKFSTDYTTDRAFHVDEKASFTVPMMAQKGQFYYAEDGDCQVLGLPYAGRHLGLYILLPKRRYHLKQLEQSLTGGKLRELCSDGGRAEVSAVLPKFKLEHSLMLKPTLQRLGLSTIFDEETADFSRISKTPGLHVSEVVHKAFVEVNEEGTEAAAASAVLMSNRCLMVGSMEPVEFLADHPFLFAIVEHENHMPVFLGHYLGPQ